MWDVQIMWQEDSNDVENARDDSTKQTPGFLRIKTCGSNDVLDSIVRITTTDTVLYKTASDKLIQPSFK